MASNKELIKQIVLIGVALGATDEELAEAVDGKSNEELSKMLSEAKADKKEYDAGIEDAAAKDAAAAKVGAEEQKAEDAKNVKKPPYYVADGKAITCKKGVLDSGDEVKAEWLGGGKDSLAVLIKNETVVKS